MTFKVKKCILDSMFSKQIILMGVAACLICPMVNAEPDSKESIPAEDTVTVAGMWEIMLRDNVITQEQYDHVQKTGSLPGGVKEELRAKDRELQTARRSANRKTYKGEWIRKRKRRRPAGHSYDVVWPRIQAKLAETSRERTLKANDRKARVKAWTQKHGVDEQRIMPNGSVDTIYDIDKYGIPMVLGSDMLADAERVNADELWSSGGNGYTLSGSGVTVGIWDGGEIRTTHDEMQTRATQVHTNDLTVTDHATAMAGIIAAAGINAQYDLDGIVYAASIKGYNRALVDQNR